MITGGPSGYQPGVPPTGYSGYGPMPPPGYGAPPTGYSQVYGPPNGMGPPGQPYM